MILSQKLRGDVMSTNCLNCPNRKLFCHDNCEKYARFKYERDLINKKHREFLDGWGYDGCLSPRGRKKHFSTQ